METISFRCSNCQFGLKVGADKAGRKAKCSKCGTVVTIPAANAAPQPPPAPAPAPPPAKSKYDDDEGGAMTFEMKEVEDLAAVRTEQEKESKAKVVKATKREETKRKAKITNPYEWRRVGFGSKVIGAGLCVWLAAYVVYHVPVALGLAKGQEYAAAADNKLFNDRLDPNEPPELIPFAIAVIAGESWSGLMKGLVIFSDVLYLLQYGPLFVGYFICLAAPTRFGTRFQVKVLFAVALFNLVFLVLFKLLPTLGAIKFAIIPFVAPEVAMVEMNGERMESLFTFWLKWPIAEVYGSILMTFLWYLEPALIATFVRTVGIGIKSEDVEGGGLNAMKLAYSQIFIQVVWLMACLCGSSLVLLWALRFIYIVGVGFFLGQLGYTASVLFSVASVVEEQLGDEAPAPGSERRGDDEQRDEEEEEDEEEEDDE